MQGNSNPLCIHDRDGYDIGIFVGADVWQKATSTLKNKITTAINNLTLGWNSNKGYECLGELVYIIGITGITYEEGCQAFSKILDLLEKKGLQGTFSNRQYALNKTDLHLNSLRSMHVLAKTANPRLRQICERDIKNDPYFGICYNILSEPKNEGFHSLITYFPDFIRFCQRKDSFMFLNNFWWIYKRWGERLLCDLNLVLPSLSLEEKEFFWSELQRTLDKYAEIDEKN